MKKLNNFWFGFLLSASISVSAFSFYYANAERGYKALGGEFFTIALPLFVILNQLQPTGQKTIKKNVK